MGPPTTFLITEHNKNAEKKNIFVHSFPFPATKTSLNKVSQTPGSLCPLASSTRGRSPVSPSRLKKYINSSLHFMWKEGTGSWRVPIAAVLHGPFPQHICVIPPSLILRKLLVVIGGAFSMTQWKGFTKMPLKHLMMVAVLVKQLIIFLDLVIRYPI